MPSSATRNSLLTVLVFALSSCAGTEIEVTTAPTDPIENRPHQAASNLAGSMQPDPDNATLPVPQIDKEVPKEFQTATFALG